MQKQIKAVQEFHTAYKLGYSESPTAKLIEAKTNLRYDLMKEIADALGDMMYILCGTIIEHGLQGKMEAVFDEIQRSNMSKLGEDGEPIYREDGKVLKGPNYSKPDFSKILK